MHDPHTAIPLFLLLGVTVLLSMGMGAVVRLGRIPALLGYMLVGIAVGPYALGILSQTHLDNLGFLTDLTLGFVAFVIGSELDLASIRRLGNSIFYIVIGETLLTWAAVTLAVYLFTRDLALAAVFGAVAPASAPAGTIAVIQELRAKGNLTKAMQAVVGFDDGLAIVVYGLSAAVAHALLLHEATGHAGNVLPAVLWSVAEIILSLGAGAALGLLFCQTAKRIMHAGDLLAASFGIVLVSAGVSQWLGLSLILTTMAIGFVLANTRSDTTVRRVHGAVLHMMPLLFVLFFVLAGAQLDLRTLPALGGIGLVYILGRLGGKVGGAWLGARAGGAEPKLQRYLGWGILCQAGVPLGLALIVKQDFDQFGRALHSGHPHTIGAMVLTTVTATCLFFDVAGPILARMALVRAGEAKTA